MNEIIEILMRRDNISREEAEDIYAQCKGELEYIMRTNGSYEDAVDAIAYWFSLEPDYLDIMLGEL